MKLKFDLEEYFKYHPPATPERVALHSRTNEMALECCKELFLAIDYEDESLDAGLLEMNRIQMTSSAVAKLLIEMDALAQDRVCVTWARHALHSAEVYACGQYKEGVLMAIQQCRMFLNQGITMDSLEPALE